MSGPSPDELARGWGDDERPLLLVANLGCGFALCEVAQGPAGALDPRLLEANPAFGDLLGRPVDELVGRALRDVLPFWDEQWRDFFAEVAWTGLPRSRVDYLSDHDRYLEVRAHRVRPGQAVVQLHDVSGQNRAEQAGRERDALVGSAMDAIVSLDEAQRVTLFNPAAEEMFRCRAADALGTSFTRFIARPHRGQLRDFLQSGRASRRVGTSEALHGVRVTGEEFPVEGSISRCTVLKRQLLTLLLRDASERRGAENERLKFLSQLQQTQKLESLGVLAGGIAHAFNNLLMAVRGHADLALDALPSSSDARDDLAEIRKAAQRATELCKQMLAYSGKGRFVVQPVELQKVIEEMLHVLRASISERATLKLEFAPNVPSVDADASQLRQVVLNLVLNASEALGDGSGIITLSTGVLSCDRDYLAEAWLDEHLPAGPYVFLEIADTGSGMDAETHSRIFDPFFTTKFTGRGLGLAAVLGIVRGHRGAIKVHSEPGKGTTVKVLLPRGQRAPATAEGGPVRGVYEGKGTVLLVDDDESVRAVGRKMLERIGFAVVTAADGAEAIARFQERADDIVCAIVDLTMPCVDGAETFRELRRLRSRVRVILSSGYDEPDVTQRFVGEGLAGFIQKPYQLATLVAVLKDALDDARE